MKRLIILAGLACSFFPHQGAAQGTSKPPAATPHDPNRPELLGLTITPAGFNSSELSVEQGLYYFLVDDQTGGFANQFELTKLNPGQSSVQVTDRVVSPSRFKLSATYRLQPGTYRLSVPGFPKWTCTIQVK
jgi:hypothetical protein